ncbi:MAG TPA: aminotransferase class V-fold PLP-dependent enzyme [Acidimicrobiia bacterium]|jgi:glutamate/tyrosine decarboxylase-like PLP-dependent enzyme
MDDFVAAVEPVLEEMLKPYKGERAPVTRIPEHGRKHSDVLSEMEAMRAKEQARWHDGFASGAVYHGDDEHIEFLNQVYALNSQANPLHQDLWPSSGTFEAEIVAMTKAMLHGDDEVGGTVSSGGTESILLAMKTYRDHARATRGVERAHLVAPSTAHAAFDKAAQYFDMGLTRVPVGPDYRADVAAMEAAITPSTVALVGSSPQFPHGVIDPIEELSELAFARGIGFHTDACLGGFLLPWAERLGARVPPFDFRLRGVTSMSCDTHKYGYAAKGTSVVLYRGKELLHEQYYKTASWSGGLYYSPTFAGSRPGALSAACWAALVTMGEEGYLDATRRILDAARVIRNGVDSTDGLEVLGDPLWVIAFRGVDIDTYALLDRLGERHWSLNGLQNPAAIHLCTTLRHAEPGVAERFVEDLQWAVGEIRANPGARSVMAPIYGMAATVDTRGTVEELLDAYLDTIFKTV